MRSFQNHSLLTEFVENLFEFNILTRAKGSIGTWASGKFEKLPGWFKDGFSNAGIPLTHRRFASSVVFVTGHEDFEKSKEAVRWKKLAKSTDTIVVMMGLSRLGIICKELVSGGMDKKTPVAVIQDGTTSKQKMIIGTVSNIAQKVTRAKIEPPSIIIIGKVVSLSKTIGWRKK